MMDLDSVFDEEIKKFVVAITGLPIKEIEKGDKWCISVGVTNPIEIGFSKSKHPQISTESMRYSAYCALLKVISEQMRDVNQFIKWVNEQKISAN